jgi:hypothetical protein
MADGASEATAWQQGGAHVDSRPEHPPRSGREPERPGRPGRFLAATQALLLPLFPLAAGQESEVARPGSARADVARTAAPPPARRRLGRVVIQVAIVGVGAIALLLRVGGIPAWDSLYAEDNGVFLVGALAHPWHLLAPYGGYEQLGPRVIGQLVASFLPLVYASDADAVAGALIASACALFIYHASEGYISSRWLRAMMAAALVLLPLAPLEIIDSGVNSPWYVVTTLFFAALWRPKSWPGLLAAALIAFWASSSEILALLYAPLLLMRLVALPRWREHAVTAGWLAGLLVQVPVILDSYTQGSQRLRSGHLSNAGQVTAFYFHNVVLRALGWKLSLHLIQVFGYNGATVVVGVALAAGIAWAMVAGGRPARVFAVLALVAGFVETAVSATITSYVNLQVPTWSFLPAARYSTLPVVLIDAIAIVGVDAYLRRHGPPRLRWRSPRRFGTRSLVAVGVLACMLGLGWVTDFRYITQRESGGYWRTQATRWLDQCDQGQPGEITIPAWDAKATVECSRLRR